MSNQNVVVASEAELIAFGFDDLFFSRLKKTFNFDF